MLKRIIIIIFFTVVGSLSLKAQFFVQAGGHCPEGEGIVADTIFYSHNKAMPIDRCFNLKYTLKGNHQIKYFAINPIDKYGNVKVRKRDYRVFIKSGWPDSLREQIEEKIPYDTFKIQPYHRLHEITKVTVKGANTEVILKVPPLDPGREYTITLISKDSKAATDLFDVGELMFKSEIEFISRGEIKPSNADAIRAEAAMKHHQSLYPRDIKFEKESFIEFQKFLYTFNIIINQYVNPDTTKINKEFRIFFNPITSPVLTKTIAQGLTPDIRTPNEYISIVPVADPDTIKIVPKFISSYGEAFAKFNDTQGSPIILNRDQIVEYKLYLLVMEAHITSLGTSSPGGFYELGSLKISRLGVQYDSGPDPKIPDGLFFKVDQNPLNNYLVKEDARISIDKLRDNSMGLGFNTAALQFLMEQALLCPCEDKGLKDITIKDDLTRALSVLFEQRPDDLKAIQLGLVSLKDINKLAKENQYTIRKENLQASIEQINSLQEFISKNKTIKPGHTISLNSLQTTINNFKGNLEDAIKKVDEINNSEVAVKNGFLKEFEELNRSIPTSTGSTSTLDLIADSKLRIIPVFGYVGVFKGNNLYSFQDFTPYLGFHINFRSLDKHIPFKDILYKSWRHRFSFMSGFTLSSLKIENKRDDFFGSFSLLTGLGFRLNSYFTITGGNVWFKTTDINPLSDDKPLRFSPFVGISLDLDLRDRFPGINNPFK